MTKKNSITAFKKPAASILEVTESSTPIKKGKVGRPPNKVKRSHKVMLSLTPDEGAKSREKAGAVQEATYIYNFLKEHGYFE